MANAQAYTGPPGRREYRETGEPPLTICIGSPTSVPQKRLGNVTNDVQKKKKRSLNIFQKWVGPYLSFSGGQK